MSATSACHGVVGAVEVGQEGTIMAKIIALYKRPADEAEFNRYYFNTHVPLAKQLPGLRSYEVSDGAIMGARGPSDVYLAAILSFDSLAAMQDAMSSDAGKMTVADLSNFATAGVDLLVCDSRPV